jgi:hypothetical protein
LLSLSKAWNEPIPFPLDYYLHNSWFIAPPPEEDKVIGKTREVCV